MENKGGCNWGITGKLTVVSLCPQVCQYQRLSPLVPLKYSLDGEFRNVRPGDCVVVFSRAKIFHVRKKIEMATQEPCAVVYGGLPSGEEGREGGRERERWREGGCGDDFLSHFFPQ